jgi:cephalosporin hydroxylase
MNGDREFVRALSNFLALHTEQSPSYFHQLIQTFMRGAKALPVLDPSAKDQIKSRLTSDMGAYKNVPSFLQNYLLTHLAHDQWPPQAMFVAGRYLRRRSHERFLAWPKRQQFVAELDGEPVRGTELGLRQMLYSQGAGTTFLWRDVPCFKSSYDLAIYAMLINELRPSTIIELGTGAGGSGLFFADLCAVAGLRTEIISIDTAVTEVVDPRVAFVQSDCTAWLAAAVNEKRAFHRPCLVIEDFHGHLGGMFRSLDVMLAAGDYLVIEDSYAKQSQIAAAIAGRPYLVDSKYTDFFGINCTSAVNSIFVKDADADTDTDTNPMRPRREQALLRRQDRAWRRKNERQG